MFGRERVLLLEGIGAVSDVEIAGVGAGGDEYAGEVVDARRGADRHDENAAGHAGVKAFVDAQGAAAALPLRLVEQPGHLRVLRVADVKDGNRVRRSVWVSSGTAHSPYHASCQSPPRPPRSFDPTTRRLQE